MSIEPIQSRQVRWMGMVVGVVVIALGLLLCAGAFSFGTEAAEKGSMPLWLGTAVTAAIGVLSVRYGVSMIRRARNDSRISTLTINEQGRLQHMESRRDPPA